MTILAAKIAAARAWDFVKGKLGGVPWWLVFVAVACFYLLSNAAWERFDRWMNPPPPVVSIHEVTARDEKARREQLEKDLADMRATLSDREKDLEALGGRLKSAADELETVRNETADPDSPVLPADDPWLRQWQSKGR